MKHKTPSPAVLRSCTEATRAAAAHAQESANWADSAKNAAEAANSSSIRCRQLTADMQSAFSRVHAASVVAYILSTVATVLAVISLTA